MRVSSNGEYKLDVDVFIRGALVKSSLVPHKTLIRHPNHIVLEVEQMQRKEILLSDTSLRAEDVRVSARFHYG